MRERETIRSPLCGPLNGGAKCKTTKSTKATSSIIFITGIQPSPFASYFIFKIQKKKNNANKYYSGISNKVSHRLGVEVKRNLNTSTSLHPLRRLLKIKSELKRSKADHSSETR